MMCYDEFVCHSKCSRFCEIGTKFAEDDNLAMKWTQEEARSLPFEMFKIATTSVLELPNSNDVNRRERDPHSTVFSKPFEPSDVAKFPSRNQEFSGKFMNISPPIFQRILFVI